MLDTTFISQEWRGQPWTHRLMGVAPPGWDGADMAVLEVTGDDAGFADESLIRNMCSVLDVPVFCLFQVPNQPLFGLREDDLIAHTFVSYLQTGDSSWPLLVPMGQAVVSALDAITSAMGVTRFVVTGASKRGWTCWMAAQLGDPRIVGIAPRVFDNLDLAGQALKQEADWGDFSPMVEDYTRRELQSLASTSEGQALLDIVDPVRFLDKVTVPQLLIHGTNDPYWTVDAMSLYWDRLRDARALVLPNQGHSMAADSGWMATLAAFARASFEGELLPFVSASFTGDSVTVESNQEGWAEIWGVESQDRRFGLAHWRPVAEGWAPGCLLCPRREMVSARLSQVEYCEGGRRYSLSAPVIVIER